MRSKCKLRIVLLGVNLCVYQLHSSTVALLCLQGEGNDDDDDEDETKEKVKEEAGDEFEEFDQKDDGYIKLVLCLLARMCDGQHEGLQVKLID